MDESLEQEETNYNATVYVLVCMLVLDAEILFLAVLTEFVLRSEGSRTDAVLICCHVLTSAGLILTVYILILVIRTQLQWPMNIREDYYRRGEVTILLLSWLVLARAIIGLALAIASHWTSPHSVFVQALRCLYVITQLYLIVGWWVLFQRAVQIGMWRDACAFLEAYHWNQRSIHPVEEETPPLSPPPPSPPSPTQPLSPVTSPTSIPTEPTSPTPPRPAHVPPPPSSSSPKQPVSPSPPTHPSQAALAPSSPTPPLPPSPPKKTSHAPPPPSMTVTPAPPSSPRPPLPLSPPTPPSPTMTPARSLATFPRTPPEASDLTRDSAAPSTSTVRDSAFMAYRRRRHATRDSDGSTSSSEGSQADKADSLLAALDSITSRTSGRTSSLMAYRHIVHATRDSGESSSTRVLQTDKDEAESITSDRNSALLSYRRRRFAARDAASEVVSHTTSDAIKDTVKDAASHAVWDAGDTPWDAVGASPPPSRELEEQPPLAASESARSTKRVVQRSGVSRVDHGAVRKKPPAEDTRERHVRKHTEKIPERHARKHAEVPSSKLKSPPTVREGDPRSGRKRTSREFSVTAKRLFLPYPRLSKLYDISPSSPPQPQPPPHPPPHHPQPSQHHLLTHHSSQLQHQHTPQHPSPHHEPPTTHHPHPYAATAPATDGASLQEQSSWFIPDS